MSIDTPKTKHPYQLRREAIDRAVKAWQGQDPEALAMDGLVPNELDDCLMDEGLILMPRSTGHGKWRVLVDGEAASLPGSVNPAPPLDAEDAAETFLTQTAADEYAHKQIVIRPATDKELVASAVIGDTTVHGDPTRIVASAFLVETDPNLGAALLRVFDKDGREVRVGLDDHMRDSLRWILAPESDSDDESTPGGAA